MNILIIGGAGFIGSHLCERLKKDDQVEKIYSIDNYLTGKVENHHEGVTYIKGSSHEIDKLVDFPVDIIFHLGEYSRVESSFEDEEFVWHNNIIGSRIVFKYALQKNIKIVYAGSSTKYSKNEDDYMESPYALYKRFNTEYLVNLASWYGGKFAITYFYNVYGEREIDSGKYATVIAKFLYLKKNGQELPVTYPGTQIRNFTHVSDIVEGIYLVGLNATGDGFNIGNPSSFSILEVAKMMEAKYYFVPKKAGNRQMSYLDISKVERLGWEHNMNLEDYINGKIENRYESRINPKY